MLFCLSKIAWALLSPLNFVLLLFVTGAGALGFKFRKTGKFLIGTAMALFLVIGVTPLGPNLLAELENSYERPEKLPRLISGIVILGGTFNTDIMAERQVLTVSDSMERILEGLRLMQRHPLAIPVFSGGEGRLLEKGRPEAKLVARWLRRSPYDHTRFMFEDQSRNTQENAQFTMEMMNPGPQEIWVVVTSAYHMPRAMAAFKAQNWPGRVVAWPTDYRTDGKTRIWPKSFDVGGNFHKFGLWLHEKVGMLSYRYAQTRD